MLSIDDDEEIERLLLAYSPKVQEILEAARTQIRQGRGISHEGFWQEVEATEAPDPA